jgi:ABC-2 type transport system permease protein
MIALLIIPVSDLIGGIGPSWIFGLAVIYFILGFFLFSVSTACTASISSTAKEAQQISSIFTIFAIFPLFLSQFIIASPDSLFAQILTYFPYTSPFITMMRLPLVDVSWLEIVLSILILVISIGVITKLAAKIFRTGMLVYGKRPGVRDIFRYLKEE